MTSSPMQVATLPAMQSATPATTADHVVQGFAFTDEQGNMTETHEHAGDFKEP